MDVIAGVASVAQLGAYSLSTVRSLQQLYTELENRKSNYHDEERNISLLLRIIQRLASRDIKDCDHIIPILLDISGLACQILHLLRPKNRTAFFLSAFTNPGKLNLALEALDKKRPLLQLYISQVNNDTLAELHERLDKQNSKRISSTSIESREIQENRDQKTSKGTETMSSSGDASGRSNFVNKDNIIPGYGEVLTGNNVPDNTCIERNTVQGVALVANQGVTPENRNNFSAFLKQKEAASQQSDLEARSAENSGRHLQDGGRVNGGSVAGSGQAHSNPSLGNFETQEERDHYDNLVREHAKMHPRR
ncbi:hypothetical protein NX059_011110 [Plenodomus lindquistii]|nr:hypothetical protein NX059_011110 [Plenodomus lindquistii]